MNWPQKLKDLILDVLFPIPELPPNIRLNDTLFCSTCRARLPEGKKICHKNSQFILAPAVAYDDRIKKMIWHLKYRNHTVLAGPLSNLAVSYIENLKLKTDSFMVIPIPLSKERLRDRGYNQAELIGRRIADRFRLPMETDALIRQIHSRPQAEAKGWDERKHNIAGCFGIANPALIKNKNVILVDDVYTSGATMSEAAHQLKDFGAKKIIGLVIAKAG